MKALTDKAIEAALKGDWHQAIEYNLQILELKPHHIPTLNRLAKAYKELCQNKKAIAIYQEVLRHDKYNSIATKNLKTLINQSLNDTKPSDRQINTNFIEEPGKTKTLPLTRLGDQKIIANLQPGQLVELVPKGRTICVFTDNKMHIGALTDDIAFQLKDLIKAGNTYQTTIKSVSQNSITIFIRETSRAKKYQDRPSFV